MPRDAQTGAGVGLLVAGAFVLLWSTGFIVAKLAAPHAPPLTFLLWRFACVVLLLAPLVVWLRVPLPRTWHGWAHAAIAGILLQAVYLGGVWFAIARGMPAGVSALIVGVQPILTAVLVASIGERNSLRQWGGLLLGFCGLLLVLSDRLTLQGVSAMAIAINVLALIGITAGALYQKRWSPTLDLRASALVQFAASFVFLLPLAWWFETLEVRFTPGFWFALGWSVLVLSLGAMTLLLSMIRQGRATDVASLMYLTPPATALMAWLLFGERLGLVAWLGVLVTVAGVALVVVRPPLRT